MGINMLTFGKTTLTLASGIVNVHGSGDSKPRLKWLGTASKGAVRVYSAFTLLQWGWVAVLCPRRKLKSSAPS